jgi:hypothetical protein
MAVGIGLGNNAALNLYEFNLLADMQKRSTLICEQKQYVKPI